MADAEVLEYLIEPGKESPARLDLIDVAICTNKGLLRQIQGILSIACRNLCYSKATLFHTDKELFKGLRLLQRKSPFDEFVILLFIITGIPVLTQ